MKIFNKMKEQKGFTLIELAIVLVIIGIIIGAVLKGQDLIESARIKRFDNSVREWETAVWTYVDRRGSFPGDSDNDGIIGNTESGAGSSAGGAITAAKFINAPNSNPMTITTAPTLRRSLSGVSIIFFSHAFILSGQAK